MLKDSILVQHQEHQILQDSCKTRLGSVSVDLIQPMLNLTVVEEGNLTLEEGVSQMCRSKSPRSAVTYFRSLLYKSESRCEKT